MQMARSRARSANQMRVILALGQSDISNFALVRKKIKEKMPPSQPISIQ